MCSALLSRPWVHCSLIASGVCTGYHSGKYYLQQLLGEKNTIVELLRKPTAVQEL